jgi:hypothetical protein
VATVTNNTAATTNHAISANGHWIRITTTDPTARIYEFEAYSQLSGEVRGRGRLRTAAVTARPQTGTLGQDGRITLGGAAS